MSSLSSKSLNPIAYGVALIGLGIQTFNNASAAFAGWSLRLLFDGDSTGFFSTGTPPAVTFNPSSAPNFCRLALRSLSSTLSPSISLISFQTSPLSNQRENKYVRVSSSSTPISSTFTTPNNESEKAKLAQAPPRVDVLRSLKNGIVILGLQATVGLLFAKALTSSANPHYQGIPPGSSPILALDVFLVQASANTILSHFLGLVFSLELLRAVTLPSSESIQIPRLA